MLKSVNEVKTTLECSFKMPSCLKQQADKKMEVNCLNTKHYNRHATYKEHSLTDPR